MFDLWYAEAQAQQDCWHLLENEPRGQRLPSLPFAIQLLQLAGKGKPPLLGSGPVARTHFCANTAMAGLR